MPWLALGGPILALLAQIGLGNTAHFLVSSFQGSEWVENADLAKFVNE